MSNKVPKYIMVVAEGCGACKMAKEKLAAPISSGDVKLIDASTPTGYRLVQETSDGELYVPKILQVIDNGTDLTLCTIDDDKPKKCTRVSRSEIGV